PYQYPSLRDTPQASLMPLDAVPQRSTAAYGKWSSDRVASRSVLPADSSAAPSNPLPATLSPVRCRCPRNIRSAASGNTVLAPDWAAPSSPRRSAHIAAPRTRQSRSPPATGSTARRKDAPPSAATPCARSTVPLVVAAALFDPFPCADSTNQRCGSHNLFSQGTQTFTTDC